MAQHKELWPNEKSFIINVIGPQLQRSQNVKIAIGGDQTFNINYCIVDNGDPRSFMDVIVLLPGFGSGWPGIAKLGLDLAKLEHQVCMISMPGYGDSSDPYLPHYLTKLISMEDAVLEKFAEKKLAGRKIHWVGHSESSATIVRLAGRRPDLVASLTLLNPAGFEERGAIELGIKFLLNGIGHWWAFRGDPVWAELKRFLPKDRSPFALNRLQQRLMEWSRMCDDEALHIFARITRHVPIAYISGEKDTVVPASKSAIFKYFISFTRIFDGLWHNTTMFGSECTADAINDFMIKIKREE